MMKRNISPVLSVLLAAILFLGTFGTLPAWSALDTIQETNRAKILSYVLRQQLDQHHYSHKSFDDELSMAAFDLFLKQLDFQKRFLIREDIQRLQPFATRIDNEMLRGEIELPQLAAELLKVRIGQVRSLAKEILDRDIPLDGNETLETDPEKIDWCATLDQLRERWRGILTYQVLNTMLVLEEEQGDDQPSSGPEALRTLQATARAKVAQRFEHFFDRQLKDTPRDHYDRYFNAVTRAFDPHTIYLPPQQKEDFEIGMRGSLEGIGATLREDDGFIKVVRVIPGSASARQGELDAEDIILAVAQGKDDPVDVTDTRLRDAVELIRGPKGTEVRLTVKKADGTRKVIAIVRDVVEIEETFVKSTLLSDPYSGRNFGYIKIPSFYRDFSNSFMGNEGRNVTRDVAEALAELKTQDISGLIIDLRNNGGGALKDAVDVSGLFIDKGPVVQVKSSGGGIQVLRDSDAGVAYDGPLAVLVNRFSASASEIFAAALQDYQRAFILGSDHTYGKGTVQTVLDLDRSVPLKGMDIYKPLGALKITTQKFYRVSGGSTQYRGVEADLVMPDRMRFIESGEKYIDYSLPWDTVPATGYATWKDGPGARIGLLKDKSQQRIDASDTFQEIIQSSQTARQRQDETLVKLNLAALRQEQQQETAEKSDSPAFHDGADEAMPGSETADGRDPRQTWQESLLQDPIAREALFVLSDLFSPMTAKQPVAEKSPGGGLSPN